MVERNRNANQEIVSGKSKRLNVVDRSKVMCVKVPFQNTNGYVKNVDDTGHACDDSCSVVELLHIHRFEWISFYFIFYFFLFFSFLLSFFAFSFLLAPFELTKGRYTIKILS